MKKFVDGGPAQQVTQFQPTFSPAQQGLGSMQQAPDTPAMESTPQDYNQSPQYAPTQQYNAPAASPMTAGLGSYMEGLQYKAPPPSSLNKIPAGQDLLAALTTLHGDQSPKKYTPSAGGNAPGTIMVGGRSWTESDGGKWYANDGELGYFDKNFIDTLPASSKNVTPLAPTEYVPRPVGTDITKIGSTSTPAAAPSTTTTYNPQTQQYTAPVEPAAPVDPNIKLYGPELAAQLVEIKKFNQMMADAPQGSPGAAGGHVNGSTIGYAQGGSIPQGIASLGRGQDSMLVHMTPGEVQGLQKLAMAHGGSLTINPQTGLPEAGFLSSILPMVGAGIGVALAPATGGMSLAMAGALGGAAGGVLGSSIEGKSPLMGALMGGISGYGMGGIGEGLAAAGAAPDINVAAELGKRTTGIDELVKQAAFNPDAAMTPEAYREFLTQQVPSTVSSSVSPAEIAAFAKTQTGQNIVNRPENMEIGLRGLSSEQGRNAFIGTAASKGVPATGLGGGMSAAMKGVGLASPLISSALTPNKFAPPVKRPEQSYNTSYNPPRYNPLTGNYDPASYGPGSYSTTQYAAQGGAVGYASGGVAQSYRGGPGEAPENSSDIYSPGVSLSDMAEARADKMTLAQLERAAEDADTAPEQAAATKRLQLAMAKLRPAKSTYLKAAGGGLMGLNTYAAGGKLLRGDGDGMSDSIPAVIQGANPQRAALADGEFVIPADVVSHLGNGSTEAGSKRLYSMMDKVRRARTGNPKQGKQINPNRFLPA